MPVYSIQIAPFIQDNKGNQQQVDPADLLSETGPLVNPVTLTLLPSHRKAATQLRNKEPSGVVGVALIDTGASCTCFDEDAAKQAGLPIVGKGLMSSTTHESEEVPLFAGILQIPDFGELTMRRAMGAKLVNHGVIALIGRDALRGCIFTYDGNIGSYTLAR